MKIMVFDVPAESGGALTILKQYYNEAVEDKRNNWIFVISTPDFAEFENVKILKYPWVKKSWFHRLYFDNFIAPNLIKDFKADEVLSLQNIMIPHTNVYQTVFLHNALPFVNHKFSIFENKLLWVYQNILSRIIFKSIKYANKVIVQTEWMKQACVNKLKVDKAQIEVKVPKIKIEVKELFKPTKENLSTFFYPASGMNFKNHNVIVEACFKLKEEGVENFRVIFTLNGDENKGISELYKKVKEFTLPVSFIGAISREAVFDYYSKSILIFPSYIETVGLPLIEAKLHDCPILVSDCEFSHEMLDGYDKVRYFNPFESKDLANEIKSIIIES
jgi:glycosyltransferase involved in cell wall biosynthesis